MKFKKGILMKMFTLLISSAVLLFYSYYYFQPNIQNFYNKAKIIPKIGTDQLIYKLATEKGFICGEKLVSDQNELAIISYKGVDGTKRNIYIPYEKRQVKCRRGISVFLTKETSKGTVVLDITHEPGVPYFLSPFDMGGKFFELKKGDEVILKVNGKEKIPDDWYSIICNIKNKNKNKSEDEIFI